MARKVAVGALIALIVGGASAACGGSTDIGPTGPDYTKAAGIQIQNPIATGSVGQIIDVKFIAVNAAGGTLISAPIAISISAGTASATALVTDLNGAGVVEWKLGSTLGIQTLTLTSPGSSATATMPVTVSLVSAAGTWRGVTGTQVLTVTLVDNGGAISGSGTLTNTPTGTRALIANGALVGSKVSLTLSSGTVQPFNLDATLAGATMTGSLL
ncbi:MAG TPA: hypothetical protein VN903_14255, partial [Polyangia bacterium]|nr:hypothetical protein [Polyangia bacterium]